MDGRSALTLLPLATVFALEFTTPAWVALLAMLFCTSDDRERRLVASCSVSPAFSSSCGPGLETLQPARFLVLAVALGFAVDGDRDEALTATESTFSILFLMNLIQLPLNLSAARRRSGLRFEPSHLVPFVGICLGGLLSH